MLILKVGIVVICFNFSFFLNFLFFFVYPPLFRFFFLEFINGVCGLRWMCCGGNVAYYVECTNVVKKWIEIFESRVFIRVAQVPYILRYLKV